MPVVSTLLVVVRDREEEHATREKTDTVPDRVRLVGVGVTAVGHWSAWAKAPVAKDENRDCLEEDVVAKPSVVAEVVIPESVETLRWEEEVEPSIFVSEVP